MMFLPKNKASQPQQNYLLWLAGWLIVVADFGWLAG
jgi:hypothetical protein